MHGDTIVKTLEYGDISFSDLVTQQDSTFSVQTVNKTWVTATNARIKTENVNMWALTLTNGSYLQCTGTQKILTATGKFVAATTAEDHCLYCNDPNPHKNGPSGMVAVTDVSSKAKFDDYTLDVVATRCYAVDGGVIVHV